MTNQHGPAAEPAALINTMPDIIDSLKRLERIGDENSKTVEKIIKAAEDLERKIASQYRKSGGSTLTGHELLSAIAKAKSCSMMDAARSLGINYEQATHMRYRVQWENDYVYGVYIDDERVSASREAALKFAKDIANGLLLLVEHDLLQRQTQDEDALRVLSEVTLKPDAVE